LNGEEHSFEIKAELAPTIINPDSEEEFITEHYWGYSKARNNNTYEYEVTHPRWDGYKVIEHRIKVNFKEVYGTDFTCLNTLEPTSVMLAEGSEITVENKRKL
jgi:hypothetical protein